MAIKIISKPVIGIAVVMIIAVGLGSLSLFWSSWSGLIALAASIGGMIAFLGLWMEKEADEEDKKEHLSNFIGDKRVTKIKSEIGWCILMVGIFIEVITAGGFAAYDAVENAKMNPRNQPIADMSATAMLLVKGADFNATTNWDSRWVARMTLCKNDITLLQQPGLATSQDFDTLDAESFVKDEGMFVIGTSN